MGSLCALLPWFWEVDKDWCHKHFATEVYKLTTLTSHLSWQTTPKKRRGIETIIADATTYQAPHTYQTIIINTGIVTAQNVKTTFLPTLLTNLRTLLAPEGLALLCTFRLEAWRVEAEAMGWKGTPSAGQLFWQGQGDLDIVQKAFCQPLEEGGAGLPPEKVRQLFATYPDDMHRFSDTVCKLGQAYERRHQDSPLPFLGKVLGGENIQLSEEESHFVTTSLQQAGGKLHKTLRLQDGRLEVKAFSLEEPPPRDTTS